MKQKLRLLIFNFTQFKSVLEISFDDKNCSNELLSLIIFKMWRAGD